MNKKIILVALAILVIIISIWLVFFNRPKPPLSSPLSSQTKQIQLSETFIEYSDPAGFTFSYPDNLSITKNDLDANTYADLLLSSKEVNGSLSLKISDSQFKSLEEWVNLNKGASGEPKEVSWGNLKALEITTADRLFVGALDQGIFFTIEMPLIEKDFWMKVYHKILTDFAFAPPPEVESSSDDDVFFEGEEVVE